MSGKLFELLLKALGVYGLAVMLQEEEQRNQNKKIERAQKDHLGCHLGQVV